MSTHIDSGKHGEHLAVDYLKAEGYEIIAVNWRYKYWEVDIIARDGIYLVFVEVKSRSGDRYGAPSDFVDIKKQRNLIQAAEEYLELINYQGEIRFDIVSVYLGSNKLKLIKDAFWSD